MSLLLPPGTTQISVIGKLVDASGAIIASKSNGSFQTPVTIATNANTGMSFGTLTLVTLANATSAFSAGGIVYLGSGDYRLDFTCSGAPQTITISAEGTQGSFLPETIVLTSSVSVYVGSNVLALNGSNGPVASLALVSNDSNNWLKTSPQINGNTLLVDVRKLNGSSSSATALSFATNDSNNWLKVASQFNGIVASRTEVQSVNLTQINGDSAAVTSLLTLARSGSSAVVVSSPVISATQIQLIPGDDYFAVDNRQLDFIFSNVPSLSGGTVTLHANKFTLNGSIQSATTVRFEPTGVQTLRLPVGTIPFSLTAVLSNGHTITLTKGDISTR